MFESAVPDEPVESALERALRAVLAGPPFPPGFVLPALYPARLHVELIGAPHAPSPTAADEQSPTDEPALDDPPAEEPAGENPPDAPVPPLGRLLEEGALRLAAAAAAARMRDRQSAVLARELAAFARLRPAGRLDRPAEEIGAAAAATRAARPPALAEVSEWAVDEVMTAFGVSSAAATRMLVEEVILDEQLPATLAAAERGELPWAAARVLAEVLPRLTDDDTRARVEADLLAGAAGRTVSQLRVVANRAVQRAEPAAAARRAAAAIRERAVRLFTDPDGLASLSAAGLAQPVAAAIYRRLEALADAAATPGDIRGKAQRMADVFTDLLLRGGTADTPPLQVALTVVATADTLRGGDEPGEVDGHPLPAPLVREVAYSLGLLPRPTGGEHARPAEPAHEADASQPTGRAAASADTSALSICEELASDLAGLLGVPTTAGTPLAALPQIAVVEEFSGQLLALTDAGEIRRTASCGRARCRRRGDCAHQPRGPGLGPPPDTPGYRPSDPLDRFVRARDRRCRFPGCRARPMRCDLDHNLPWPAGPTSHDNLCCLCRHHHRLTHQAPGWRLRRLSDGGLEWTTPGGDVLITHPPRHGTDDQPPVERAAARPDPHDDPPF